jgi:hypothetical protein
VAIEIDEDNLKHGVLGLVMAIVEVVRDALQIQALKRAESGMLSDEEMNRLGDALMELDIAIEEIKKEQGITGSVKAVRDGLDEVVDDVLDRMINPERWREEADGKENP